MNFFLSFVLFVALCVCDTTRFETRHNYERPKDHIQWSEITYSVPPRKTKHSEQTETLFYVMKDSRHVHHESLHHKKVGSDDTVKFNIEPPTCCGFISLGARLEQPVNFILDTTNPHGLMQDTVLELFGEAVKDWEEASQINLVENLILGDVPFGTDVNVPDGFNHVFFAAITEPGVIAFAATHGDFRGSDQRIFEIDIVFNTLIPIGIAASNGNVQDFLTVALHELGHGFGLGHTPTTAQCQNAVMFPSLAQGDIKQLTSDDAQCIAALYDVITFNNTNDGSKMTLSSLLSFFILFALIN